MAAVLQGLDPALADAAKSLGANPLRAFLEVTLPLTRAGMLSSVILAFVISFHEFIMALFLATPSTRTLPVVVWTSLRYEVRPIIASIDSLMIVSVIIALILIARLVGIEKIKLA
jgi:putative spermidine/putrescine transport system permease protein